MSHEIKVVSSAEMISLFNNELKVSLFFHKEQKQMNFQIDYSYDFETRKNKIAVTKWLLSAWKYFLMHYPQQAVYADVYSDDGRLEYRKQAYSKLGFKSSGLKTMVWGRP